ncbi:MAG: hypothetical protein MUC65_10925 [Pontiellaceae bacterium]|jgi:hypothetical protein|nr:hypothetical protein [Pontiellaceae bacterium]
MNKRTNLYARYTLNKVLEKNVSGGKILGVKYGFNANSGSIGSFVYAMPGFLFTLLALFSVLIALLSSWLFGADQNSSSEISG